MISRTLNFSAGLPQQAEAHQFAADRRPFGAAVFLADAIGGELRVTPFADFFRVRAGQHFDDVIQPDAETVRLADAIDAGEKFLRGQRAVERVARREAVVARPAAVGGKFFAEIGEQFPAAASRAFGVMDHLLQLFAGDLLLLRFGFSSMNCVCFTTSPGLKSKTHSPGRPSRPARPVSW